MTPKWRRSCRKPHFKEWHMVYERRDIYKYDYWSIISLHQSRVLPVNLRSRPSQMSSFLHHWLETWLCLILANEGTWKKGTSRHKRKAKDRRSEARGIIKGGDNSLLAFSLYSFYRVFLCTKWRGKYLTTKVNFSLMQYCCNEWRWDIRKWHFYSWVKMFRADFKLSLTLVMFCR